MRATLVTDERGGYAYSTIVSGHYPGRESLRHIHVHLSGPDVPEHWIDDVWFAGDRYLSAKIRARHADAGTFSAIVDLEPDGLGGWLGRRDLILDPELVEPNGLVDGWYRS